MSKNFYCGIVESRDDPLKLGRVRVRIAGCHTPDKQMLPTSDLPWAVVSIPLKRAPKEGTVVTVEFWDYPENQMPIVTGIMNSIPQRESVFIDQPETPTQIKDDIAPAGRKIPTTEKESKGGMDSNSPVDSKNLSAEIKIAQNNSSFESPQTQTSIVNLMTNDTVSSIGGIGSAAQIQQSVGSSTKNKNETLLESVSTYGDIAKAQLAAAQSLCTSIGSAAPTELISGKITPAQMMSEINSLVGNINNTLGPTTTAELLTRLSTGNNLDSYLSQIDTLMGYNVSSDIRKYTDYMDVLNLGSITNFVGTYGGGLSSLQSEILRLSNLGSYYSGDSLSSALSSIGGISSSISSLTNNLSSVGNGYVSGASNLLNNYSSVTSDYISDISSSASNYTSIVNNLTNLTNGSYDTSSVVGAISAISSISSTINNAIGDVSVPSSVKSLIATGGDIKTSLTEKANEMIGKGYSSVLAVKNNVGGVTTAENIIKSEEQKKTDLKNTNTSLTTESFKGTEEGKTPPLSGSNGGSNYAGANATNETPEKQDSEKYSFGTKREVDLSWVKEQGDLYTIYSVGKENGISTNESLSAYLTIIYFLNGGFEQKTERTNFTEKELRKYFPITFGKSDSSTIREYTLGKHTNIDFLSFVYDSANDGITYGNQYPSDGKLYYGYGYIKIIGRSAYTKYAKVLNNKDLISKGAEALENKPLCAKISALEFLERTKHLPASAHPQFFYQACSIFGVNVGQAESVYGKFYGSNTQDYLGVGKKSAGMDRSSSSLYRYSGDETQYGFGDPNKKYPSEDEVCESNISKLSRGDIKNTIVTLKEQKRRVGVPLPMNMGTWDQPHSSFGAHYPFNDVDETESGHVIEVDDTPNRERLHWYHRSGTFTEIDQSGVKVNRVVGDNYTIIDRNGFISIEGEADVTVGGNVNVYCRSNANIQVEGSAALEIGRNLDIGVAKDINIRSEGDFNVWANGDFNLQAKNNGHILAKNNLYSAADKNIYVFSGSITKDSSGKDVKNPGNIFVESYGNSDYRSLGNTKLYTAGSLSDHVIGDRYNEVKGKINNLWMSDVITQIGGKHDIGVSGETKMSSGGNTNIKAGGDIYEDGSQIRMNEGKSKSPSKPISEEDFKKNLPQLMSCESIKALIHGMIPPALGTPLNVKMDTIEIQEPGDMDGTFETEDEMSGELYQKVMESRQQLEGKFDDDCSNAVDPEVYEGDGENVEDVIGEGFASDYKLSDHFTIGMLTSKATCSNGRNSIKAQKGLTEAQIVTNLKALCVNVLENIIEYMPNGWNGFGKSWKINSGFRWDSSPSNAKNSQHTLGQAVDIQIYGFNKKYTYEKIQEICKNVPFDQAILEYGKNPWIHISYNPKGNRTMSNATKCMTMKNGHYSEGFTLYA